MGLFSTMSESMSLAALIMAQQDTNKKPDDFETTEEYIKNLNEEIELDKDTVENLTSEGKEKYGEIGAALELQTIREKYNVELTPDFLKSVKDMKKS